MERKKASDFPQELLDLFHLYVHGEIDRRTFSIVPSKFAVGRLTAAAMFDLLKPNYAWAQQVPKDDKRIQTEYATVPSPQGNGIDQGLLRSARERGGKLPGVLVVHENRGLNPYIEDVARRLGTENFLAFAPDGLTSVGGYPGDDERGGALFGQVDRAKMTEDFVAVGELAESPPGMHRQASASSASASAAGLRTRWRCGCRISAPPWPSTASRRRPLTLRRSRRPCSLHHGELDTRLAGTWPDYDKALTAAGVPHEGYIYPKANHGFHNDTTPRYDEEAAKLAWKRTLDWFNKYLRG